MRKDELAATIADLGFVQVDSVNVLERAHHHILFSRSQTYRRPRSADAGGKGRRAVRELGPTTRRSSPAPSSPTGGTDSSGRSSGCAHAGRAISVLKASTTTSRACLLTLPTTAPAMARDFEGDKPSSGWWDWHPSKAALEFLWRTGDLAIARREGFQKVYDPDRAGDPRRSPARRGGARCLRRLGHAGRRSCASALPLGARSLRSGHF
jgi:hypothetical protein